MKKIAFAIVMLNFACAVKSQVNVFGKIGVNYAYLEAESFKQNSIIGYQLGLTANYELNKKFVFQPEVLFSEKGGELNDLNYNGSDYFDKIKTKRTYIDFPMLLKYNVTRNNKIDLFINAGVNPGFCIWTKQTAHTLDMESNINGPDTKFAFGLIGGAGLNLFNVSAIELRYEYGLNDVLDFPGETYMNRVYSIAISYRLFKGN